MLLLYNILCIFTFARLGTKKLTYVIDLQYTHFSMRYAYPAACNYYVTLCNLPTYLPLLLQNVCIMMVNRDELL